jgi:hypothetical protein
VLGSDVLIVPLFLLAAAHVAIVVVGCVFLSLASHEGIEVKLMDIDWFEVLEALQSVCCGRLSEVLSHIAGLGLQMLGAYLCYIFGICGICEFREGFARLVEVGLDRKHFVLGVPVPLSKRMEVASEMFELGRKVVMGEKLFDLLHACLIFFWGLAGYCLPLLGVEAGVESAGKHRVVEQRFFHLVEIVLLKEIISFNFVSFLKVATVP